MKVKVIAKPNSKFEKIEEDFEKNLKVWIKEPPKEGKANQQIIKLIAQFHLNYLLQRMYVVQLLTHHSHHQ